MPTEQSVFASKLEARKVPLVLLRLEAKGNTAAEVNAFAVLRLRSNDQGRTERLEETTTDSSCSLLLVS